MDDDEDHCWPSSSMPSTDPWDREALPPLPAEELLQPPLPSSPQHLFLGELQVDGVDGDEQGEDTVDGQGPVDEDAENSMAASQFSVLSVEDDNTEEGREPPNKRSRSRDSPDGPIMSATDMTASTSSDFSLAWYKNTASFDNDIDIYADLDDDDDVQLCDGANASRNDNGTAEGGSSEREQDMEDESEESEEEISSMHNSLKAPIQESFQNERDSVNMNRDYETIKDGGTGEKQDDDIIIKDNEMDVENNDALSSLKEPTQESIQNDEEMVVVDDISQQDEDAGIQSNNEDSNAAEDNEDEYWEYDSDELQFVDALLDESLAQDARIPRRKRKAEAEDRQESRKDGGDGGRGQKEELPKGVLTITKKSFVKGFDRKPQDLLPPGWITVVHDCGMPLYLHRPSRVVTWARPYLLGSGSARRHKVPLNSIPCLHYKREKERKQQVADGQAVCHPKGVNQTQNNNQECQPKETTTQGDQEDSEQTNIETGRECQVNGANQMQTEQQDLNANNAADGAGKEGNTEKGEKSEGSSTNHVSGDKATSENNTNANSGATIGGKQVSKHIHICKDESIGSAELKQYLEKVFEFETHAVTKYRSWADRRRHMKEAKQIEALSQERPEFPTGPTLITCQVPSAPGSGKGTKEFVINALNKSPVCILHEYSQRVMKTVPTYIYTESGNANTPFEACVDIGGTKYGRGQAKSKKFAKIEAAQATLKILIPDLYNLTKKSNKKEVPNNLEYFDHVAIDDLRVYELCERSGLLTPWQLLQEYQQRNHGMSNMELQFNVKITKHQRSEYTMTFGEHVVTGMCKNKKLGKQFAAQKILVKLHPHLTNWGAIIKMYGRRGMSSFHLEKKELKASIVELQGKAKNKPNERILNKLKLEMKRLYMKETQTATEEPAAPQPMTTTS